MPARATRICSTGTPAVAVRVPTETEHGAVNGDANQETGQSSEKEKIISNDTAPVAAEDALPAKPEEDVIVQPTEISFMSIRRPSRLYQPPKSKPTPDVDPLETEDDADVHSTKSDDKIPSVPISGLPPKEQELNAALKAWNILWRSTGITRNSATIELLKAAWVKGFDLVQQFEDRLGKLDPYLPEYSKTSDAAGEWLLDRLDEIQAKLDYSETVLGKLNKARRKAEKRKVAHAERKTKKAVGDHAVGMQDAGKDAPVEDTQIHEQSQPHTGTPSWPETIGANGAPADVPDGSRAVKPIDLFTSSTVNYSSVPTVPRTHEERTVGIAEKTRKRRRSPEPAKIADVDDGKLGIPIVTKEPRREEHSSDAKKQALFEKRSSLLLGLLQSLMEA